MSVERVSPPKAAVARATIAIPATIMQCARVCFVSRNCILFPTPSKGRIPAILLVRLVSRFEYAGSGQLIKEFVKQVPNCIVRPENMFATRLINARRHEPQTDRQVVGGSF